MITSKDFASFCEKGAVLREHLPAKKALNCFRPCHLMTKHRRFYSEIRHKCSVFHPGQVVCPQSSAGTDLTADKQAQESFNQCPLKSMLVISGGEGYIDFRMGKKSEL